MNKQAMFLVLTNKGSWGKDYDLKQALKNCKHSFPCEVILYRFPAAVIDLDSIRVGPMGEVSFHWLDGHEELSNTITYIGNFEVSTQLNLKPITL